MSTTTTTLNPSECNNLSKNKTNCIKNKARNGWLGEISITGYLTLDKITGVGMLLRFMISISIGGKRRSKRGDSMIAYIEEKLLIRKGRMRRVRWWWT